MQVTWSYVQEESLDSSVNMHSDVAIMLFHITVFDVSESFQTK